MKTEGCRDGEEGIQCTISLTVNSLQENVLYFLFIFRFYNSSCPCKTMWMCLRLKYFFYLSFKVIRFLNNLSGWEYMLQNRNKGAFSIRDAPSVREFTVLFIKTGSSWYLNMQIMIIKQPKRLSLNMGVYPWSVLFPNNTLITSVIKTNIALKTDNWVVSTNKWEVETVWARD